MPDSPKKNAILISASRGLKKTIYPLSTFLVYMGAGLSLAMALIVILDILLRLILNNPILGVIELETFMLAILCFFSLAYTKTQEGHVRVDLFVGKLSPKFQAVINAIFLILGIFVFGVLAWQYVRQTLEAVEAGEASIVMNWPMWPLYLVTSLGCAMMALVLLSQFLDNQNRLMSSFSGSKSWSFLIFPLSVVIIVSPWLLNLFSIHLAPMSTGVIMVCFMLALLFLGMPVAFTMGLIGILGTWYLAGLDTCMGVIRMAVYGSVANYFFCVVPFFILMGFFCLKAGVSQRLYQAGNKWFGQMPGGLAIGTIAGCGGFAAICGDSMATAATMGSVSLPEMKANNYDDALATGSVAAGGTLGILIPPSLGFIVYGIITEESVGKLFMAGIIPGVLLTVLFATSVFIRCKSNPGLGPKAPKFSFKEKIISIRNVWPVMILFMLVIGGIYLGFFTPTEAGGVGVIGAFVIALFSKEFSWKQFLEALMSATQITSMIACILIGVTILGYFITLTEIPMTLADIISSLNVSRYVMLALILFLYLILGMVMNIIPMIMLTLPIIFPTILALGFDPIWFGVIMVIMMEMGQISPPVGLNVFVIAGVSDNVPMGTIFKGVFPFILVEIVVITILTIWPDIVMMLPNAMDVLPAISD